MRAMSKAKASVISFSSVIINTALFGNLSKLFKYLEQHRFSFSNFRKSPRQDTAESHYSNLRDSSRNTTMDASRYTRPCDLSSLQETLILPTPPASPATTAVNGSTVEREAERRQYSVSERRPVSGELDSYQAYSKDLGSRYTDDDVLSQTCPPGETGRYLRHSSGKEYRRNFDQQPKHSNYPAVGQRVQNEDSLSNSSVESQVQARKAAPKKPERKKLKKTQEESSNVDFLIQEQMKLEKELKELQKIREQMVPPLDLRELHANQVEGISDGAIARGKRSPRSKDLRVSPSHSGHLISGPAHSIARPELMSDDSVDREVEGLLSEMLFSGDSEDDTSPLKGGYLSPELETHIPQANSVQYSPPRLLVNGYHNGFPDPNLRNSYSEGYSTPAKGTSQFVGDHRTHEPSITNGYVENYSTTPQHTPQFVSAQSNYSALAPSVSQDKVGQFCLLKKQEMYWMNRVRQQRQILAQPLNTVVRHEVEEQYFYAQEELSRIENAIADLFQRLSPEDVQQLIISGMIPSGTKFIPSPYNLDALRTTNHISLSGLYNQLDQRSLPQHHQQHVPYPVAPGSVGNVPQRTGYQPTLSQPQYNTSIAPSYVQDGENLLHRYQDTSFNSGNTSRQFQRDTDAIRSSFVKPPCTNKETQTFNRGQVRKEVDTGQRLVHNFEISGSASSNRQSMDQDKTQYENDQYVEQINSTKQPRESGNDLRIEADDSQVYSTENASVVEDAALVSGMILSQPEENTAGEGTVNEKLHSNAHGRQKPTAVKQPSFDDHEVVKLKEKLEQEQQELRDSLKREQMKFLEEQRRLKEEEERQNEWMVEQENQRRMRESLVREAEVGQEERSVDEVRNLVNCLFRIQLLPPSLKSCRQKRSHAKTFPVRQKSVCK